MNPSGPGGTTVILNEYAKATDGIEQVLLDCIGNVRLAPPARAGSPKAPGNPWPTRVSTTRQGVIPTKTRAFAPAGKLAAGVDPATARSSDAACSGCQYG